MLPGEKWFSGLNQGLHVWITRARAQPDTPSAEGESKARVNRCRHQKTWLMSQMSAKPDNKSTKRKRERRSRFAMQYIQPKLNWLTSKVNNTLAFVSITNIPTSFHTGRTESVLAFFHSLSIIGFNSHNNFHNVSGLNILHNFIDLTYLSVKLRVFNTTERAAVLGNIILTSR